MTWITSYPQNKRPAYNDLLAFLQVHIRSLFLSFDREMRERYKVHNKYHRFSNVTGWVYGYGRSYNCELLSVSVENNCFNVLGISVRDDDSLQKALTKVKKQYDDGFEENYSAICTKRREEQIARTKLRTEREKKQMTELTENVDMDKFNKFKWCKKVSRRDLYRLYKGEAKGLLDEDLLEDIGLTFYTRCKQAKETRACMDKGQIICHHCRCILTAGRVSPTGSVLVSDSSIINCECGYSYTYREYRRSCNAVNMPGGRAYPIFEHFIQKWPGCREVKNKMLLIDWLIHECHVTLMSGEKGRSVCINLIEGTLKQIAELIIELAYGSDDKEQNL